ncbi:MAG TPA: hypothetical protein VHB21_01650, partial [Minicystis sp.]|nr:hypothetical protein [Minicystis sp.]
MRSIARIGAAAAAVLFVAGVPARADAAGPAPSAAERADAHGRWSDARTLLLSRWARDKSPETAAALGHAELRLGLAREAAEHLSAALRGLAKTDPARGAAAADL